MKYRKHSKLYHLLNYAMNPSHCYKSLMWKFSSFTCDQKFIFIVGAPRSGTTMMQKIIGGSKFVKSFTAETEVYSVKNIFNYNRFKSFIDRNTFDKAISESRTDGEFLLNIHKFYLGDSDIYLEKTPQHALSVRRITQQFPNAKIIHMIRDPRDSFVSGKKGGNIPQAKKLSKYLKYWVRCNKRIVGGYYNENVIKVKYEDFVSHPEEKLKEICNFAGVDYEQNMLDMSTSVDPRSRLKQFSRIDGEINNSSVGQWRKVFGDREERLTNKICGKLMQFLGYDL